MTKNVETSSFVFKLATKYTFFLMMFFVIIDSGKWYFGQSNSCTLSTGVIVDYNDRIHTCWNQGEIHLKLEKPGFIVLCLLYQTLCFILPLAIWYFAQKKTKIPTSFKKLPTSDFSGEWIDQRQLLIDYIRNNSKEHQQFAISYLDCVSFSIYITLINMMYMNTIISDFWNMYPSAATSFLFLNFPKFNRDTSRLFPKQATCSYFDYGASIYEWRKKAVCTFPQNFLNDKIFAIIYIWYIFILTWSVLHLIVLFVEFSVKKIRLLQIRHMFGSQLTMSECKDISGNGNLGLWFTLCICRRNMRLIHYQDLCKGLLTEATYPC